MRQVGDRRRGVRIAACTLVVLALGSGRTAIAQRDSAAKMPSGDSARVSDGPTSVAQAEAEGMKLLGIMDASNGAWVDHATVRDTLGNETVTSNIGIAALSQLEPLVGFYMLEVRKAGYAPRRLKLKADTASDFLVALTPNPLGQATTLPTVVSTAAQSLERDPGLREGFFARCQMGSTACVGRKDLDLRPTEQLSELVANVPGITRTCTTTHRPTINGRRPPPLTGCVIKMLSFPTLPMPADYCIPTFFLNGTEWTPMALPGQQELDQFVVPANTDGIEIYLSGQPRPLRWTVPSSVCGAIVIWTH